MLVKSKSSEPVEGGEPKTRHPYDETSAVAYNIVALAISASLSTNERALLFVWCTVIVPFKPACVFKCMRTIAPFDGFPNNRSMMRPLSPRRTQPTRSVPCTERKMGG